MGHFIIKKSWRLISQSTTLAATSLCNTLIIIVLRPPLLQKANLYTHLFYESSCCEKEIPLPLKRDRDDRLLVGHWRKKRRFATTLYSWSISLANRRFFLLLINYIHVIPSFHTKILHIRDYDNLKVITFVEFYTVWPCRVIVQIACSRVWFQKIKPSGLVLLFFIRMSD